MITTIQQMNTKKFTGEGAVVTGASRGICAAIARLMKRPSVIDIVERFQTQHALQEEREIKNFRHLSNGAADPGVPDNNGTPKIPRSKESSPSHAGLIVGRLRLTG